MYKWIMFTLFCVACVIAIVGVFPKHAPEANKPAADPVAKLLSGPVDANAAQTLFKQNCMKCHGANLGGGVGPNLQKVGRKMSGEQIFHQIQNGGGVMPAFKGNLTNKQIATLAKWLATKS